MCLLVLAWQAHPRYRLILAANRDEFHARPTAPMQAWQDQPNILAGRDLSALGTWLAVDRQRRFGVVTNFREVQPRRIDAPSRGGLIPDWLNQGSTPATFFSFLQSRAHGYAGFNLLLNDADSLWYGSNRAPEFACALPKGIYGLSNLLLDSPAPKLIRVRAQFEHWLNALGSQQPATEAQREALFAMLADRTCSPPEPAAGAVPLPPQWAQILSSAFVVHPQFGTRCSTVALIGHDGSLCLQERRFDAAGVVTGNSAWQLAPGDWPAPADA